MYAAIADVIEHQKERPMTLWFEILDDEIAAAPGVKIEEHVIYATCVVKVTKENFAGRKQETKKNTSFWKLRKAGDQNAEKISWSGRSTLWKNKFF